MINNIAEYLNIDVNMFENGIVILGILTAISIVILDAEKDDYKNDAHNKQVIDGITVIKPVENYKELYKKIIFLYANNKCIQLDDEIIYVFENHRLEIKKDNYRVVAHNRNSKRIRVLFFIDDNYCEIDYKGNVVHGSSSIIEKVIDAINLESIYYISKMYCDEMKKVNPDFISSI